MVPQETCDLHLEMEICSASELLPGDFCPEEEIETRIFLNRPEFQLTDERWRGAGRGPQDAAQMPPEEQCDIHTVPATAPSGFDGYILQNPPRVLLRWNAQRDIVEYRIYRKVSGKTSGNNQEENTGEENEGAGINEELLLQTLPGTVTQYLDSWVEAETEYTYSLVAINTEGIKSAPLRRVLFIPRYNSPGDQNGNGNNNDGSDNEGGSGDDRDHHRDDDDDDGHDRPPQRDPDRWPPDNNENRDRRDRNNRH
jgi:penicillin-binding protein 1A